MWFSRWRSSRGYTWPVFRMGQIQRTGSALSIQAAQMWPGGHCIRECVGVRERLCVCFVIGRQREQVQRLTCRHLLIPSSISQTPTTASLSLSIIRGPTGDTQRREHTPTGPALNSRQPLFTCLAAVSLSAVTFCLCVCP